MTWKFERHDFLVGNWVLTAQRQPNLGVNLKSLRHILTPAMRKPFDLKKLCASFGGSVLQNQYK